MTSPPHLERGGWKERAPSSGNSPSAERILVIKLGALGDVIMALGPAKAIRAHHPLAHITLLTTQAFAGIGQTAPFFDEVWIDARPNLLSGLGDLWRQRQRLRGGRFDRVYDLQTSDRSSLYFTLMGPGPRPEWSGIARGASHFHANPDRDSLHTIERQKDQLGFAGIGHVPPPDVSFLAGDLSGFGLNDRGPVLLAPGGSTHRPEKRWPAASFAELATKIDRRGFQPVLLGGPAEQALAAEIKAAAPEVLDLTGQTDFAQIASLARRGLHAVGNDTGPMHLIAAAECPVTVLFSGASDPGLTRPRSPGDTVPVTVLRRQRLADLSVSEVAATLPTA